MGIKGACRDVNATYHRELKLALLAQSHHLESQCVNVYHTLVFMQVKNATEPLAGYLTRCVFYKVWVRTGLLVFNIAIRCMYVCGVKVLRKVGCV